MTWLELVSAAELHPDDAQLSDRKLKDSLTVECHPEPNDFLIAQRQNRAVCLFRPYPGCPTCPHSSFVLAFNPDRDSRFEVVACPRWAQGARETGQPPEKYVATERSTCAARPFGFCSDCPSEREVADVGADKKNAGWYGRWKRLKKEDPDG